MTDEQRAELARAFRAPMPEDLTTCAELAHSLEVIDRWTLYSESIPDGPHALSGLLRPHREYVWGLYFEAADWVAEMAMVWDVPPPVVDGLAL